MSIEMSIDGAQRLRLDLNVSRTQNGYHGTLRQRCVDEWKPLKWFMYQSRDSATNLFDEVKTLPSSDARRVHSHRHKVNTWECCCTLEFCWLQLLQRQSQLRGCLQARLSVLMRRCLGIQRPKPCRHRSRRHGSSVTLSGLLSVFVHRPRGSMVAKVPELANARLIVTISFTWTQTRWTELWLYLRIQT